MCVIAAGSVGEYCGIQHLSTTGAFPGIKGTDKVIKLLGEHAALTTWTLHSNPPNDEIAIMLFYSKGDTSYVPRAATNGNKDPALQNKIKLYVIKRTYAGLRTSYRRCLQPKADP
jgi:hypothetical protein